MSKVLVTGIGGNVGYGILRNIRNYFKDIELIGTNTVQVSAGNHLCDSVYKVPFSTSTEYIPVIRQICEFHKIDLIIPATDYETLILSENSENLPLIATSPAGTTRIFLDKYLSYTTLRSFGLAFAQSILPSAFQNEFDSFIVKPREGRGSRNIFYNPENPKSFSDDYIVQPLLKGKEITTAFYITRQGNFHGMITFERELDAGATSKCEVNTDYDASLELYIKTLIKNVTIVGACNIQSIVTENGIIPFEVNCRISGTNSIRSQFGFRDVSYTIDEFLFNKEPEKPEITEGSAIRIMHDIIYPGTNLDNVKNCNDNFYIYE